MARKFDESSLIFIGATGSGKNTQIKRLMKYLSDSSESSDIKLFKAGSEVKKFAESDHPLSGSVKRYVDSGHYVGDDVILPLVENHFRKLSQNDIVIFDAFPQTARQADYLDDLFFVTKRKHPIIVIYIKISVKCAVKRMYEVDDEDELMSDNESETVKKFARFKKNFEPIISYYKTNTSYEVIEVDGEKEPDEVCASILEKVEKIICS